MNHLNINTRLYKGSCASVILGFDLSTFIYIYCMQSELALWRRRLLFTLALSCKLAALGRFVYWVSVAKKINNSEKIINQQSVVLQEWKEQGVSGHMQVANWTVWILRETIGRRSSTGAHISKLCPLEVDVFSVQDLHRNRSRHTTV